MAARQRTGPDDHGGMPAPLTLAVGALAGGVRRVRDLPSTAVRLPLRGLNLAFQVTEKVQREAAQWQERGEQLLGLVLALRGTRGQEDSEPAPTAYAPPAAVVEPEPGTVEPETVEPEPELAGPEPAEPEPATAGGGTQQRPRARRSTTKPVSRRAASGPRQPAKRAGTRPEIPPEAAQAGAPGAASATAAAAEREAARADVVPGDQLSPAELPLADFDQLSLGSLRSRLPRLDRDQLVQLLEYERVHAGRLQVVTMLENRIAKVQAAAQAESGSTAGDTGDQQAMDEVVAEPDGDAAQAAADEFGSNSPHP